MAREFELETFNQRSEEFLIQKDLQSDQETVGLSILLLYCDHATSPQIQHVSKNESIWFTGSLKQPL